MAQEYPGIQSAFEVFTSKFVKKKKKNNSPKSMTLPGGAAQVSPLEHEFIPVRPTQRENDIAFIQLTDEVQPDVVKKKRRKNASNEKVVVQQTGGIQVVNVVKKKRKRKCRTSNVAVVQLPDERAAQLVDVTMKKKKRVALKTNEIIDVLNGSFDESCEEGSVVELPVENITNEDTVQSLSPKAKKKRKVNDESVTDPPKVKQKKSDVVLANGFGKESRKLKKAVKVQNKNKNGPVDDSAEGPSTASDSVEEGQQLFSWLIDPITTEDFFRDTWEQRPLMIKRLQPDFYQALMSTATIHKMLERDNLQFTKNVDVTSYRDGKRETHNPEGRAFPAVVWSHYGAGCSVRLLNPQTFIPKLHLLNTTLQEYFGCFVGANAYLTPPKSQGFAPHYDDIEAFILQLEGQKEWKLYAPRTEEEYLPRFSSDNLTDEVIGQPIMEVVLNPGDLLYFPRGTIHQGRTLVSHSLHVTLSCYQRNTWGDLLDKAIPAALRYAMDEDVELRRGLPRDYLRYMGSVHSDRDVPERQAFVERLQSLVGRLFQHLPVDAAVDQLGKQFMHDALPPMLTTAEKQCTVFGDGLKMMENGKLSNRVELGVNTRVKLLRAHVLRLVVEDEDVVRLYHYVENSLEYHGNEPQFLELPVESAPAVELLIHSYPAFVPVADLPLDSDDDKVQLASELWARGLLMTDGPLDVLYD